MDKEISLTIVKLSIILGFSEYLQYLTMGFFTDVFQLLAAFLGLVYIIYKIVLVKTRLKKETNG